MGHSPGLATKGNRTTHGSAGPSLCTVCYAAVVIGRGGVEYSCHTQLPLALAGDSPLQGSRDLGEGLHVAERRPVCSDF